MGLHSKTKTYCHCHILPGMSTREDIHRLVDQLPEEKLQHAEGMLTFIIHPPETPPELTRLRKRGLDHFWNPADLGCGFCR